MTREEAAKRLKEIRVKFALFSLRGTEELPLNVEALDMAIEELKRESCDDCISRQAVLEQINCWIGSGEYGYTNATHYLTRRIQNLPFVTPQSKEEEMKIETLD